MKAFKKGQDATCLTWLFKEKVLCNEKNACSIHANVFFQKTYGGNKIYF